MIRIVLKLWLVALFAQACAPPPQGEAVPVIEVNKCLEGIQAGVACAHPEAARVGAEILARGGNAIDAAIAMQWALAVCFPEAGNIGGGGFMVARMDDGSTYALDYREAAPAAAHRDFYLDEAGKVQKGKSTETPYSAGIPGTVSGLYAAHARLGRLEMEVLIEPAISLAITGFPVTSIQANNLNRHREAFLSHNDLPTAFAKTIGPWNGGDTLAQPELAAALKRIQSFGPEGFYSGTTGQMMVDAMRLHGSWFTSEDLLSYKAQWREPIRCSFDSISIISMPPPSSGGIALCQLVDMSHRLGVDSLRHNSAAYIHTLVELQRRVYADRATHIGDPDFCAVPVAALLDSSYLTSRITDFNPQRATPSENIKAGPAYAAESMETTHLSVVDAEGNAVSVTTTINDIYGSKIVVAGAGFLLNNEMDDFSIKPGAPNMFGLVGGSANAVAPRKRMLSSMTPTIVEANGALYLVAGSPGGSTIINSVLQTVLNTTVYLMDLEAAINAPKFHSQWLPDEVVLEADRFEKSTLLELEAMGHQLGFVQSLGRVDALMVLPDGTLKACGDMRSDNSAGGYRK